MSKNPWRDDPALDKFPKCYFYRDEPVDEMTRERLVELVGILIRQDRENRADAYDRQMRLLDGFTK